MARDIRTTLAVDGEQAYTRAIKEASKSITQMGAQLTLATAQFKADGDAMKLMESRSKTLRAEISQQENIVKSLAGAVSDITERFGENSKEAEKWEAELARAQAKLINLQTELRNNDQGLDKNGKAFQNAVVDTNAFNSALQDLNTTTSGLSFDSFDDELSQIELGFSSIYDKAKEFFTYLYEKASDSSYWADDLATESEKLGVSVEQLQGWMDAAHFVDTEVSTIGRALTRLLNPDSNIHSILNEMNIALRDAEYTVSEFDDGVSAVNVEEGDLRHTIDIFWDVVEGLGAMTDATEKERVANEIFKQSYRDLLPLINKGKDTWDAYIRNAEESGRVLDQKSIDNLTQLNDSIEENKLQTEAWWHQLSADMAPGLKKIIDFSTNLLKDWQKTWNFAKENPILGKEWWSWGTGERFQKVERVVILQEEEGAAIKDLTPIDEGAALRLEESLSGLVPEALDKGQDAAQEMAQTTANAYYEELSKALSDYGTLRNDMDFDPDLEAYFYDILKPSIDGLADAIGMDKTTKEKLSEKIHDAWFDGMLEYGLEGTTQIILKMLQEAMKNAESAESDAATAGGAVARGLALGIINGIPEAVQAAGSLADAVNSELRRKLEIASPSKVTRSLGEYVGIGFAEGIADALGAVEAVTGRMARAVTGRGYGYAGAGGNYSPHYDYARTMNIQNYYQRSDADIDTLMDAMNQEARYERAGRGS